MIHCIKLINYLTFKLKIMKNYYVNSKNATMLICKSQAEAVQCVRVLEINNFGKDAYISQRSKKWQITFEAIKYCLTKAKLDHTFIIKN